MIKLHHILDAVWTLISFNHTIFLTLYNEGPKGQEIDINQD